MGVETDGSHAVPPLPRNIPLWTVRVDEVDAIGYLPVAEPSFRKILAPLERAGFDSPTLGPGAYTIRAMLAANSLGPSK